MSNELGLNRKIDAFLEANGNLKDISLDLNGFMGVNQVTISSDPNLSVFDRGNEMKLVGFDIQNIKSLPTLKKTLGIRFGNWSGRAILVSELTSDGENLSIQLMKNGQNGVKVLSGDSEQTTQLSKELISVLKSHLTVQHVQNLDKQPRLPQVIDQQKELLRQDFEHALDIMKILGIDTEVSNLAQLIDSRIKIKIEAGGRTFAQDGDKLETIIEYLFQEYFTIFKGKSVPLIPKMALQIYLQEHRSLSIEIDPSYEHVKFIKVSTTEPVGGWANQYYTDTYEKTLELSGNALSQKDKYGSEIETIRREFCLVLATALPIDILEKVNHTISGN